MNTSRVIPAALAVLFALGAAPAASGAGFTDVLNTQAVMSPLASRSLMQAVAQAGNRLVAVGQRGHIVVSTDGGKTWKQSPVPVSSDLTAVYFVDEKLGWAAGHDGVVLHTSDGGDTWSLQLDGRKANDLLLAAMKAKAAAEPASEDAKRLLGEAERYQEQGADKPFLDVWFANANEGWVVGAYNVILRTTDGGKTWEPWFDRTDNPKFFNLYAIRPAAQGLFIAGEGGLLLKLDPQAGRFKARTVPYKGSLFGVTAAGSAVLAFGLRGNVFRSDDGGNTWAQVDAGLSAAVVSATQLKDSTLLGDAGGRVVALQNGGAAFQKVTLTMPMPITGLADAGGGRLAITGPRGVAVTEIAVR